MKYSILLFFTFICLNKMAAQDTITKYSGEIISAKILEISPAQIKYKKFNNQDGPLYVENKSEIKVIRYSNGTIEEFGKEKDEPKTTIAIAKPTTTAPTTATDDYYGGTITPSANKIYIRGSRYSVDGQWMNEKNVQKLLMETKDKKIISLVGQAKDAHKMQYIGFAAFPLGLATLYALGSAQSYGIYGSPNNGLLALSAVCFAGTIACPIISSVEKHKRKNCNREAIRLYNEKF